MRIKLGCFKITGNTRRLKQTQVQLINVRSLRTKLLAPYAAALSAVGVLLCGGASQAAPSISGVVLPNAHNNQGTYAIGSVQFQGAVPPKTNFLSFQVTSATGITTLMVQLQDTNLPGVVTTTSLTSANGGLTVSGASTNETITAPLAKDTTYGLVITAADSSGSASFSRSSTRLIPIT